MKHIRLFYRLLSPRRLSITPPVSGVSKCDGTTCGPAIETTHEDYRLVVTGRADNVESRRTHFPYPFYLKYAQ